VTESVTPWPWKWDSSLTGFVPRSLRFNDLTGKRLGKLVALYPSESGRWVCRCDCGAELAVRSTNLVSGNTRSCGCSQLGVNHSKWGGHEEIPGVYLYALHSNAAQRGYAYNLTSEFLWDLYVKQNRKCALSGMPIKFLGGKWAGSYIGFSRQNR
jgi:hypothetical protein